VAKIKGGWGKKKISNAIAKDEGGTEKLVEKRRGGERKGSGIGYKQHSRKRNGNIEKRAGV